MNVNQSSFCQVCEGVRGEEKVHCRDKGYWLLVRTMTAIKDFKESTVY